MTAHAKILNLLTLSHIGLIEPLMATAVGYKNICSLVKKNVPDYFFFFSSHKYLYVVVSHGQ
jgi:hypothetical protein